MVLTRDELAEIDANVDRGVVWLEECGVWIGDIDPNSLEMTDACRCVVGQVGEPSGQNYYDLVRSNEELADRKREELNLQPARRVTKFVMTYDEATERGFHLPEKMAEEEPSFAHWEALNAAWKKRIIEAREAA